MVGSGVPGGVTAREALAVAAVARDLLRARQAAATARRLCQAVREIIGADGATFVLREGDEVYYAEEDAISSLWKGRRFPAAACISGWAVFHRETAVIEDVYTDERIPVESYRPTFVKSLAMAPMTTDRDDALGALGAYWSRLHRATPREVWLLEQLAGLAADALCSATDARRADSPGEREGELREGLTARLLAVVGHDLRQPLSNIRYAVTLLRARGSNGDAELLRRIERGASGAMRLVEQMLDYGRLSDGRLYLRLEHTRLDTLCRSVVADLGLAGDRIRMELDPVEALCDSGQLRQAVTNLVQNAVQHGDDAGPISVSVGRDGDTGRIVVHNHGRAIPPEARDSLFLPFRRFSPQRGSGSVGLGLYIAQQIIQTHGGNLDVESSDDEGTTFVATLPLGATSVERPTADRAGTRREAPTRPGT